MTFTEAIHQECWREIAHAFGQLLFRARDYTTAVRDCGSSEREWNQVVNEAIRFHDIVRRNTIFWDVAALPDEQPLYCLFMGALAYAHWWFRAGEHGMSFEQWDDLARKGLAAFTAAVQNVEPWDLP